MTLIKNISKRLSTEGWPLIDATLKQFSLPTSDRWSGSIDSYVLEMIEKSPDQTLIELAQYVGFKLEEETVQRLDPPFWQPGMFRIFLSHLAAHRSFAAELQESFFKFGISCFVAHNDIEPTEEWQTQIETALSTCDCLIALLHKNFHVSNWTDQEIGFAMGRSLPAFSVRFDQDPYGFIGRFQAFNGNGKSADSLAEEMFDAFRKHKQTQHKMSEVLVRLFEQSYTYSQSKSRIGYLEELEIWDPMFSTRIQAAINSNSQISDSWHVPNRVEALVKKWATSGA